jgi:hypothetical protein
MNDELGILWKQSGRGLIQYTVSGGYLEGLSEVTEEICHCRYLNPDVPECKADFATRSRRSVWFCPI